MVQVLINNNINCLELKSMHKPNKYFSKKILTDEVYKKTEFLL